MADESLERANSAESTPAEVVPEAGHLRESESKTLEERFLDRRFETVLLVAVSLFSVAVTFAILFGSVDLYFPADAAHYVGDADALLGRGVREIRHPLFFPALLALFQPFAGEVGAFHVGIGVAAFLLPVSLHLLLRRWLSPIPSLAGAALGSLTPPVGELFGWGGGATLIALDFMLLSIAFMETWIQKRGKQGIAVGVFVGLTALSHPFVLGVTLFVLAVLWAFDAFNRRSFSKDWGPLGLRGIGSALAIAGVLFSLSASYYIRLTTVSQASPLNVGLPGELLLWSVRENVFWLFFFLLGVLLPLPLMKRNLFLVIASFGLVFVAIPTLLPWEISYASRVVYFLPVFFSVGGGLFSHLILEELRSSKRLRKLEAPLIVALLLSASVGTVYGLGYTERLQFASGYYQRIHVDDLPALDYLRHGSGTVATSWPGAFQDEGSVNAWFVEALSKRPAFGPGAPWLSTLTTVGPAELDMQRLFSGAVGLENGDLQISGTRTGGLRDPSINVNVGGFYYPLLYVNSYANGYPISVQEGVDPTIQGTALVLRHPATAGADEIVQASGLDGNAVNLTFTLVGGNTSAAQWSIWIWPAYFRAWDNVLLQNGDIETTQSYRSTVITSRVQALTPGSSLTYYPSDPRWDLQGIDVRANGTGSVTIRVTVENGGPVNTLQSFDEATLLARYDVTNVLLWKDTGWEPRFDSSPRFHRGNETSNLLVYDVVPP